jgi:hypothetical protein
MQVFLFLFWVYLTIGCLTPVRSRFSYNHTYQHAYLCVYVCVSVYMYIYVLLSIRYSWLPNSLFLLDTGSFLWTTTSCRPCHRTFLPGFHRFRECVFSWLSTEILCLSESVDFPSLFDVCLPVFFVLLVCVCVFSSHVVYRQTNRHSREISDIVPAHTRAHTHAEISVCICI